MKYQKRSGKYQKRGGKFIFRLGEGGASDGPTGLAVSNITDDSATLNWNALTGATSYVIEGRIQGGAVYGVWGTTSNTDLDISSLASGTAYEWRVKAIVSGSDTLYSEGPAFQTTGSVQPNAPKLLKPIPFFEELEVDLSVDQITLGFKDGVKFSSSVSIQLQDEADGSLVKDFGSSDRSISGHWNHTLVLENFALQLDKSYSLVITPGSIEDLASSEPYPGLSFGAYTFNMKKSSYTELYLSPNGNDLNSGTTAGDPRSTLAGIWPLVGPNTRINLAPGIYRQIDVTLPAKVNHRNPVIIKGAGVEQSFISGAQILTGWTSIGNNRWKTALSASGFASQACWLDGDQLLTQIGKTSIYHNGNGGSEQYLEPEGNDESDLIPGSFYHKASSNEIFVQLPNNENPNNHLLEASRATWVLETRDVEGLVLQDLTIEKNGNDNRGLNGCWKPGPRQKMTNCRVRFSVFQNFRITSNRPYLQVENCEISYAGNVGLDANNGSVTVNTKRNYFRFNNNEVHHNNYRGFYYAWHTGGFKMIPGMFHVVVDGNNFYENHGPNIWFDHPMGENLVENNTVTGHSDETKLGQGIFYEVSENLIGAWGVVIRNNLLNKIHRQGIYISASEEAEVYNNTVLECWTPIVMHGMPRQDTSKNPTVVYKLNNNKVYNNILENKLGATGSYAVVYIGNDNNGDPSLNNTLDQNFYNTAYSGSSPNAAIAITAGNDYGGTDVGVGAGSSACGKGYECQGIAGDALFQDRANGNFIPQSGSPAEGKGYLGA